MKPFKTSTKMVKWRSCAKIMLSWNGTNTESDGKKNLSLVERKTLY